MRNWGGCAALMIRLLALLGMTNINAEFGIRNAELRRLRRIKDKIARVARNDKISMRNAECGMRNAELGRLRRIKDKIARVARNDKISIRNFALKCAVWSNNAKCLHARNAPCVAYSGIYARITAFAKK